MLEALFSDRRRIRLSTSFHKTEASLTLGVEIDHIKLSGNFRIVPSEKPLKRFHGETTSDIFFLHTPLQNLGVCYSPIVTQRIFYTCLCIFMGESPLFFPHLQRLH